MRTRPQDYYIDMAIPPQAPQIAHSAVLAPTPAQPVCSRDTFFGRFGSLRGNSLCRIQKNILSFISNRQQQTKGVLYALWKRSSSNPQPWGYQALRSANCARSTVLHSTEDDAKEWYQQD
jgi:hypothetical protein